MKPVGDNFPDEYNDIGPLAAPMPPPDDDPLPDPSSMKSQRTSTSTPAGTSLKKKPKREINPDFKDVQETGKWGNVSKREIMAVGIFVTAVIIAVIVVVVILLTKDNGSTAVSTRSPVSSPTIAPSMHPSPEDQLAAILNATTFNPILNATTIPLLPSDVAFYEQKVTDMSPAVQRAMAWIMFQDPAYVPTDSSQLIVRFALAVLYYNNGGANWTHSDNWLTGSNFCDWYGITCDFFGMVLEEMDLSNNNLVGTVPDEINYFQTLRSLWLRQNDLTGTLPALPLGQLPVLTVLYLNENKFNGTFSTDIRANGVLSTLYIQKNDLTGDITSLCEPYGSPQLFSALGLDCLEVICPCCGQIDYKWFVDPCFY